MKKLLVLSIAALLVLTFTACGDDEKQLTAVEQNGIISAFAQKQEGGLYSLNDVTVDSNSGIHALMPYYVISFDQNATSVNYTLDGAYAKGIDLTDENAFKTGTVAFVVTDLSDVKVYQAKNGDSVRGEKESATVYLYDIETQTFFAEKRFEGASLDDTYENYCGGDMFVNEVDFSEIDRYIESLCD